MTNLPPQPGGWIDGSGSLQPGSPPPGFWQASDGRWYPPDLSSAATRPVAPEPSPFGQPPSGPEGPGPGYNSGPPNAQYPPQHFGAYPSDHPIGASPGFQAAPGGGGGSKTGLYIALGALAAIVLLVIVSAGVLVRSSGTNESADPVVSVDETAPAASSGSDPAGSDPAGSETSIGDSGGPEQVVGSATCVRLDADYIEVDFVNDSAETSNYILTVIYRDDAGNRVADDSQYVNALRPGERSLERHYVFEEAGTQCEIAELDRLPVPADDLALAESSTCEITGESFSGDAEAKVTITNSGAERGDFAVEIAVIDAENVRRGTAYTSVDAVSPGESAPSDTYTTTPYSSDLRCEAISASFLPSS